MTAADSAALPELPRLDARLTAAAELVPPGARVADVGCDHGKLSVYLALSGRARRVLAIDVRPQPLERARQLVEKTGCGQLVECRLADGLSCVSPGEADTVVLAGISGVTAVLSLSFGKRDAERTRCRRAPFDRHMPPPRRTRKSPESGPIGAVTGSLPRSA